MRQAKYKAWDSYQKEMYSWAEIGKQNEEGYLSLWNLLTGHIRHITPLEYTGLTDKNGKEIYEGDIVKCNDNPAVPVEFLGGVFYGYNGTALNRWGKVEIIGNIYESPELMEKEDVSK